MTEPAPHAYDGGEEGNEQAMACYVCDLPPEHRAHHHVPPPSPMTLDRKCDLATGVFTHSRHTERTPCEGEVKRYVAQIGGDVYIFVCEAHRGSPLMFTVDGRP